MIKTICYHEISNLVRERLVILMAVTAVTFTLLGLFNGYESMREQQGTLKKISAEQQETVKDAKIKLQQRSTSNTKINWWDDVADVRGYAFYLMVDYAVKPPSTFSSLAIGQSDIYPYFFRMQVDTRQALLQEKNTKHPLVRYLGQFDLAFFLVFVLPLLLITLNFNAVAQERESNQLRLLIIQGLTPARLLLLQLCIRSSIVLLPIFCITTVWLVITALIFHNDLSISFLIRLVFVLLMILAYSLFWITLSALCVAQGKSAAHNATVLVACWLLLVIVIPMTSNTLVNIAAPLPSRITYIDSLRASTNRIERDTEKALAGFFHDHPELVKNKFRVTQDYALIKIAKINAIENSMREIDEEFVQQLEVQQKIGKKLKWLSPTSLFYHSLVNTSENGLVRQREFLKTVEDHHRDLRTYFQQKIAAASARGDFSVCDTCTVPVTFSEFDDQPRFKYVQSGNATNTQSYIAFSLACVCIINLLLIPVLLSAGRKLNKTIEAGQ